jgi:hypothetical protein
MPTIIHLSNVLFYPVISLLRDLSSLSDSKSSSRTTNVNAERLITGCAILKNTTALSAADLIRILPKRPPTRHKLVYLTTLFNCLAWVARRGII